MKKKQLSYNEKTRRLIIEILPADWEVSEPIAIKICQQPALVIQLPRYFPPQFRRSDIWQLNECSCSLNQTN